jgi:hypothetical protein
VSQLRDYLRYELFWGSDAYFRLIFGGRQMEEGRTLGHYNVIEVNTTKDSHRHSLISYRRVQFIWLGV